MFIIDESNKIKYSYLLVMSGRTRQVKIRESYLNLKLRNSSKSSANSGVIL